MNKKNKNIIISADDFGISRLASENILKLVSCGKVDRVEVMMSKNISPSQVQELLESNAEIDIHLHLLKNKLDFWQEHERKIEDGAALRGIKFLLKYALGITGKKNIEKEWQGQIEDFVKIFGKVPDGISSHEHIHFFPPYFACVQKLCKKFGITYIRFGKNNSANYSAISKILNWLREKNLKKFNESDLFTADFMISFDWVNDFGTIFEKYPANSLKEVVLHLEKTAEFDILANIDKSNFLKQEG
jgi:predicted glycoside hydrolase/deacetylase ChbG (UPF0249 family)